LNIRETKDALGHNGLVNKGKTYVKGETFANLGKATISSGLYSKKWVHNDLDKPHTYYGKSFFDNQGAAMR